jgi:hypothetical protein
VQHWKEGGLPELVAALGSNVLTDRKYRTLRSQLSVLVKRLD